MGAEPKNKPPEFVPVVIPSVLDNKPLPEDCGAGLTVRLMNDIRIELANNFNATTLIKAVASLGGMP